MLNLSRLGTSPAMPANGAARSIWRIIRVVLVVGGMAFVLWLNDSFRARGVGGVSLQDPGRLRSGWESDRRRAARACCICQPGPALPVPVPGLRRGSMWRGTRHSSDGTTGEGGCAFLAGPSSRAFLEHPVRASRPPRIRLVNSALGHPSLQLSWIRSGLFLSARNGQAQPRGGGHVNLAHPVPAHHCLAQLPQGEAVSLTGSGAMQSGGLGRPLRHTKP